MGLVQDCTSGMTVFGVFTSLHMSAHICSNKTHPRAEIDHSMNLQFNLEDYSQGEGAIVSNTPQCTYGIIINLNVLNTQFLTLPQEDHDNELILKMSKRVTACYEVRPTAIF